MLTIGGNLCVNLSTIYAVILGIGDQEQQAEDALDGLVFIAHGFTFHVTSSAIVAATFPIAPFI